MAIALFATLAACGGRANTVSESVCDPLAPKPITLGAIVGVGKDVSGTLYVDSAAGIFVSDSDRLIRQHVTGSGQSGSNEFLFTFEPPGDDGASTRNLLVETQGSAATAMALGPAGSRTFLGQSDAGVTPLTLVESASVSGMPIVNTPNVISYVGDVANGYIVTATVPMNGDSTSDHGGLSIFYGPPSGVSQRTITAFQQSKGNVGTVTFLVGGTPYVLAFGVEPAPDAGPLGAFTLEGITPQGGAQLAVALRLPVPTTAPTGLSFTCLP